MVRRRLISTFALHSLIPNLSQAVIALIGGVAGYARKRSIPSLVAGVSRSTQSRVTKVSLTVSCLHRPLLADCI